MDEHYAHLGAFSDWVATSSGPRARAERPDAADVRDLVSAALSVGSDDEEPADVEVERTWVDDGLAGQELSWSVGYGPRTHAFLLRPAGDDGPLPGVLALHGHDGFKWHGKEKVADGPEAPSAAVLGLRDTYFSGRAWANDLARRGFAVLVPDTFGWGSRRFPLEEMPPVIRSLAQVTVGLTPPDPLPAGTPGEVATYNAAAWHHEHLVEKYCALLGTTLAAVVAREDRIALDFLLDRGGTTSKVGAVGLSGGGCRATWLRATTDRIDAAVVVGMMTTYDALLDRDVVNHTWMLLPPGVAGQVDWPDVAASRAPQPLLVQYCRDDAILPLAGAQAAHARIAEHYAASGEPDAYTGTFHDGPHAFDTSMQAAAFTWLDEQLR